jgi:hypothetical protein
MFKALDMLSKHNVHMYWSITVHPKICTAFICQSKHWTTIKLLLISPWSSASEKSPLVHIIIHFSGWCLPERILRQWSRPTSAYPNSVAEESIPSHPIVGTLPKSKQRHCGNLVITLIYSLFQYCRENCKQAGTCSSISDVCKFKFAHSLVLQLQNSHPKVCCTYNSKYLKQIFTHLVHGWKLALKEISSYNSSQIYKINRL